MATRIREGQQHGWYKGRADSIWDWYWSATRQCLVVYVSRLEVARIMLADFDPAGRCDRRAAVPAVWPGWLARVRRKSCARRLADRC